MIMTNNELSFIDCSERKCRNKTWLYATFKSKARHTKKKFEDKYASTLLVLTNKTKMSIVGKSMYFFVKIFFNPY